MRTVSILKQQSLVPERELGLVIQPPPVSWFSRGPKSAAMVPWLSVTMRYRTFGCVPLKLAEPYLKQFILQTLFDSDQDKLRITSPTNRKATPLSEWLQPLLSWLPVRDSR
jgi:hypothetical protein